MVLNFIDLKRRINADSTLRLACRGLPLNLNDTWAGRHAGASVGHHPDSDKPEGRWARGTAARPRGLWQRARGPGTRREGRVLQGSHWQHPEEPLERRYPSSWSLSSGRAEMARRPGRAALRSERSSPRPTPHRFVSAPRCCPGAAS